MQEPIQEVKTVVSLLKNGGKSTRCIDSPPDINIGDMTGSRVMGIL